MNLKHIPDNQLRAELERREQARDTARIPEPVAHPNWEQVVKLALASRDEAVEGNTVDSETPHYIYEQVMVTVFGGDYFVWHREQTP